MLAIEGKGEISSLSVTRRGGMSRFASAFWIGLNVAAGAGAIITGMNPLLVGALTMAFVFPALLDHLIGRRDQASDGGEIWVVFSWLGLSFVAIWASGGALSPLSILLALGPLHAFAVGRFRVGVEASVFAAFGFLGIAALERMGYGAGVRDWLGIIPSLWVLISVLQIGVFIAAAHSGLRERTEEVKAFRHWQNTLWGVPIMVLNLNADGQIRSWLGSRQVMGAPDDLALTQYGVVDLFANSEEIRGVDAAPVRLKSVWPDAPPIEGRLLRAPGGYRLVLSPVSVSSREAETMRQEAEDARLALEGQAKWVASLGHELRNLLNPVSGYADLILSERAGPISAPYKNFATSIRQSAEHLTLLVDDLMTATKSRAGHLTLSSEALNARTEIEESFKLTSAMADGNSVSLLMTDGPDHAVFADRKALRQILLNLLSNAIKYSPPNGKVKVSVMRDVDQIRFDVRDQGAGISEADLARIGEAFFQGENAKGRAGTGLGLSIVKMLVETMNGRFELHSNSTDGTRASVWLPVGAESDAGVSSPTEAEAS